MLSFKLSRMKTSRRWKRSSEQARKSLPRATKSKTNWNASGSARNIRRCTVSSENPTEPQFCTSVQKTGLSRSRWSRRTVHGTSILIAVSKKSCSGESERMRPPQLKCARNSPWQRKTRRGLKLIAYPAEYQSSGVKTFVVTQRGIVFEKDLGPETTRVAPQMKARTGPSWHAAE